MQQTNPQEYFRRRAVQESTAADNAADERAAQLHRALASELERMAAEGAPLIMDDQPSPGILASEFRILP